MVNEEMSVEMRQTDLKLSGFPEEVEREIKLLWKIRYREIYKWIVVQLWKLKGPIGLIQALREEQNTLEIF